MTDHSEPTTAAGRELKDTMRLWFFDKDGNLDDEAFDTWWPLILAIEVEARQPDSEALRLLRARIDAEPFFPKGDGPSIGNAAAFRDYKRRILAALPPSAERSENSDPPALHEPHKGKHTDYACGFSGPHCWGCNEPWPCRASRGRP